VIEASIARTFQALPKNDLGRLPPAGVRHAVRTYFARQHGWQIRGLEPIGAQVDVRHVQNVTILQERAPALLEALLEARHSDWGLSLEHVAALVVFLERLVVEESVEVLASAYVANDLGTQTFLAENILHKVLATHLLKVEHGRAAEAIARRELEYLLNQMETGSDLAHLRDMSRDAIRNYAFQRRHTANPFVDQTFSFGSAAEIVRGLARQHGREQNAQCSTMKEQLMTLDRRSSGYVPLGRFYAAPRASGFDFSESANYLRQIGALDESWPSMPRVRIANYLLGPTNCMASTSFLATCCLDECAGLMGELEGSTRSPTASADRLIALVSNLSSSTIDAPRVLPRDLVRGLRAIASSAGGEVPLHGRKFAEWMHRAFPHECANPHFGEDAQVLTAGHWESRDYYSPADEMEAYIHAAESDDVDGENSSELGRADLAAWSEDEVLPMQADWPHGKRWLAKGAAEAAAVTAFLATGLAAVRAALTGLDAARAPCGSRGLGEAKGSVLPRYM